MPNDRVVHMEGKIKTGRADMQSFTGDGKTAFTNIYHETKKDGVHLGKELPLTIGRAEGINNKANASHIVNCWNSHYELLAACKEAMEMYYSMPMEMKDMNVFRYRKIQQAVKNAETTPCSNKER